MYYFVVLYYYNYYYFAQSWHNWSTNVHSFYFSQVHYRPSRAYNGSFITVDNQQICRIIYKNILNKVAQFSNYQWCIKIISNQALLCEGETILTVWEVKKLKVWEENENLKSQFRIHPNPRLSPPFIWSTKPIFYCLRLKPKQLPCYKEKKSTCFKRD